jgi:hypothetical protein
MSETAANGVGAASPRAAAAIAAAGVAVLLLASLPPPQQILVATEHGDPREYLDYARRTFEGQAPYRDFRLEYPPGALPVLLAAGPADHGYFNRFRLLMLMLGTGSIVLLVAALFLARADPGAIAAGALVPATLPLTLNPGLVFERFDLWPVFLMLPAVVALLRGHQLLALVALSIGAVAKLFPLALVPLVLLARRGHPRLGRDVAIAAAVGLAFLLPFEAIAPRGLGHVGTLLLHRPLQSESLGASILLASHRLGLYAPTTYLSIGKSWDLAGARSTGRRRRGLGRGGYRAHRRMGLVRPQSPGAPRASAGGRRGRRRLRRLRKDLLDPIHGLGRNRRAARPGPD